MESERERERERKKNARKKESNQASEKVISRPGAVLEVCGGGGGGNSAVQVRAGLRASR